MLCDLAIAPGGEAIGIPMAGTISIMVCLGGVLEMGHRGDKRSQRAVPLPFRLDWRTCHPQHKVQLLDRDTDRHAEVPKYPAL